MVNNFLLQLIKNRKPNYNWKKKNRNPIAIDKKPETKQQLRKTRNPTAIEKNQKPNCNWEKPETQLQLRKTGNPTASTSCKSIRV